MESLLVYELSDVELHIWGLRLLAMKCYQESIFRFYQHGNSVYGLLQDDHQEDFCTSSLSLFLFVLSYLQIVSLMNCM